MRPVRVGISIGENSVCNLCPFRSHKVLQQDVEKWVAGRKVRDSCGSGSPVPRTLGVGTARGLTGTSGWAGQHFFFSKGLWPTVRPHGARWEPWSLALVDQETCTWRLICTHTGHRIYEWMQDKSSHNLGLDHSFLSLSPISLSLSLHHAQKLAPTRARVHTHIIYIKTSLCESLFWRRREGNEIVFVEKESKRAWAIWIVSGCFPVRCWCSKLAF